MAIKFKKYLPKGIEAPHVAILEEAVMFRDSKGVLHAADKGDYLLIDPEGGFMKINGKHLDENFIEAYSNEHEVEKIITEAIVGEDREIEVSDLVNVIKHEEKSE